MRTDLGLQKAIKIVRSTRLRLKQKKGRDSSYVRGWRAGLAEAEWLLKININLENKENGPRTDNQS